MSKKMKKLMMLLAVGLVALGFAACGSDDDDNDNGGSTSSSVRWYSNFDVRAVAQNRIEGLNALLGCQLLGLISYSEIETALNGDGGQGTELHALYAKAVVASWSTANEVEPDWVPSDCGQIFSIIDDATMAFYGPLYLFQEGHEYYGYEPLYMFSHRTFGRMGFYGKPVYYSYWTEGNKLFTSEWTILTKVGDGYVEDGTSGTYRPFTPITE